MPGEHARDVTPVPGLAFATVMTNEAAGSLASAIDVLDLPSPAAVDALLQRLRLGSADARALLTRYRQDAPALRHYGLLQWQAGQMAEAVEAFRAALTSAADDADLWRDLAGAYDGAGRPELAVVCIEGSIALQPHHARSWLMLAGLRSRAALNREAERAYEHALQLDPALGEAHFGLGLLRFAERRLEEAAASLTAAVANGYATATGFAALGHVLYLSGSFSACAAAFEAAAGQAALDPSSRRKHALARTLTTIIEGRLDDAWQAYPALAGADAQSPAEALHDAFSILSAYGHRPAAVAVGRLRLAQNPDDAAQRYLLDALEGRALMRAPVDYLESHFDGFAGTFDQKLVEVLQYDAPEQMALLLAERRRRFGHSLDLGCGTGLAARHLAPMSDRLTGVDVSGRMLEQATTRGLYAALVKAEALDFLAGQPACFDLVFAADVLVYFGDLRDLFERVAACLLPGGLFAASIETMPDGTYMVLPSGRFAHAIDYAESIAAPHFRVVARKAVTIRLEAGRPALGMLTVLERR